MTRTTVRYDSSGSIDRDATLIAEGRRQVGLVIQDVLRMSEEELRDLEESNAEQGER